MVGLAQPGMMLDWPRLDPVTDAGKDEEDRVRGFTQPFHLNIFAYKLTTQIFCAPRIALPSLL